MCASGKSSAQSAEKYLCIVHVLPQSKDFSMNMAAGLEGAVEYGPTNMRFLPEGLERDDDVSHVELCLKI